MRLLELFTIMELRDRISYAVDTYGRKVAKQLLKDYKSDMHIPSAIRVITDDLPVEVGYPKEEGGDMSPETEHKIARHVVNFLAIQDPTPKKKYLDWIVRQYINGKLWLEDAEKMETLLDDFDEYKKGMTKELLQKTDMSSMQDKNAKDINSWKDYRDLASVIRELKSKGQKIAGVKVKNFVKKDQTQQMTQHDVPSPQDFDDEDIWNQSDKFDTHDWYESGNTLRTPEDDPDSTKELNPVYVSDRVAVYEVNTKRAACYISKGTEWCTGSTKSQNYFWEYASKGPLYLVLTDKHGKFQWHFETGQFMDVHDEIIPTSTLGDITKEYPELRKVFKEEAEEEGLLWLMDPAEWTPERLEEYMKSETHLGRKETTGHPNDVLFDMPKSWDGDAPEETLLAIEAWIRAHGKPQENWRNVRHPTEEDLLMALQAPGRDIRDYNPTSNILKYANSEGVELSDKVFAAAVERDGNAILHMPPDKIKAHPEWIRDAVVSSKLTLPTALKMSLEQPDFGSPDVAWNDADVGKAVIETLRDDPQGIEAAVVAVKQDPSLVIKMGGYFGTKPWKMAYTIADKDHPTREDLDVEIDRKSPPIDYVDLLTHLVKNGGQLLAGPEIHLMEKNMPGGKIPVELQHAIVQLNPYHLNYIWKADPSTATLAGQVKDQQDQTAQQQIDYLRNNPGEQPIDRELGWDSGFVQQEK